MQRTVKTAVMYRKFPSGVIGALFPEKGNYFTQPVLMYRFAGYSQEDYATVIMMTRPAEVKDYSSLHRDLINQGYELRVIKKRTKR